MNYSHQKQNHTKHMTKEHQNKIFLLVIATELPGLRLLREQKKIVTIKLKKKYSIKMKNVLNPLISFCSFSINFNSEVENFHIR